MREKRTFEARSSTGRNSTVPLLAASSLIPLQPRPDKTRPIAVGQVLRRLVTKVLLPAATDDTRDRLSPEQVANVLPSGMDAIDHDCRKLMVRHDRDPNYVLVSVDTRNTFNTFSRQVMLHLAPLQTPTLARFQNIMYGPTVPDLIQPSSPPLLILIQEGSQQGDPASMLVFSLAIQPLTRRLSRECNLAVNLWYTDDGNLIGNIAEVIKALRILRNSGPAAGFHVNFTKCSASWTSSSPVNLSPLLNVFPDQISPEVGMVLVV